FETALSRLAERDAGVPEVEIEYHSFELSPDTPVDFDGTATEFLAQHKGIPLATAPPRPDQVTELAAGGGLEYRMGHGRHTKPRTADELLHVAKAFGKQAEMKERLLRAYFTEGRHVGRVDELADLAAEVGLEREAVVVALEAGTFAEAVA